MRNHVCIKSIGTSWKMFMVKEGWKEKIINLRREERMSVWQNQKRNPISFLFYLVQTEEHEMEKSC